MGVAGDYLGKGIDNADKRSLHLGIGDTECPQQRAVRSPFDALLDRVTSQCVNLPTNKNALVRRDERRFSRGTTLFWCRQRGTRWKTKYPSLKGRDQKSRGTTLFGEDCATPTQGALSGASRPRLIIPSLEGQARSPRLLWGEFERSSLPSSHLFLGSLEVQSNLLLPFIA